MSPLGFQVLKVLLNRRFIICELSIEHTELAEQRDKRLGSEANS